MMACRINFTAIPNELFSVGLFPWVRFVGIVCRVGAISMQQLYHSVGTAEMEWLVVFEMDAESVYDLLS